MSQIASQQNDQSLLLSRLQAGEQSALKELFFLYYDALVAFARPILKDEERARDMVQDVFFKLWERREDLNISSSLKAYLYMAVKNHALNALKREERMEWTDEESSLEARSGVHEAPYEQLREKDLQRKLSACLDLLPEKCRQVFELSRFDEMSNKEIAACLEISVKTVENHMTKALGMLRKNLLPLLKSLLLPLATFFS